MKKEIDFENNDLADILFDHFFVDITGHAKLIDEFHADPKSTWYHTVKKEKILFNDELADDPDWIVKQCYLLMLAACAEVGYGVEAFWKNGKSTGRKSAANFGQYMPKNYFDCFRAAAPYVFAEKSYWYLDRRDKRWDIFTPALASMNKRRHELFKAMMIFADESMSGWRPKTSQTGGLENLSFEPRKPVPLGTELKNSVECMTGILTYQDVQMAPEKQKRKAYYYQDADNMTPELSHLPERDKIAAHVAEVLRQVEGSNLEPGGWIGGDAWFGSVQAAVETYKRFGVHSTFIIKNNCKYFPMKVLHAILSARHGERPAGNWVVMSCTIAGVDIKAIAYAWSKKGVSYFVTTCGSTEKSTHPYESKFENEFGRSDSREIGRPELLHMYYQYAPLIDQHNKERQGTLRLEKKWPTRDAYFRLIATLLGQATVDMYRFKRHVDIKKKNLPRDEVDAITIEEFVDMICMSLKYWKYKQRHFRSPRALVHLERIAHRTEIGRINNSPSKYQRGKGKTVGNPITLQCYICRKYLDRQGKPIRHSTSWWCSKCHMPLCNASRAGEDGGREKSCLEEHETTNHNLFCCQQDYMDRGKAVPKTEQLSLYKGPRTRRQVNNNGR